MGQLMSAVGCGENKRAVQALGQADDLGTSEGRPSSALTLIDVKNEEQSDARGSAASHTDLGNSNTTNNNNNSTFSKGEIGSAGSSGFGSKPPTPPGADKPWGARQPISFISGRIPSAYENIPTSDLGESLDVRRATQLFQKDPPTTMLGSTSASSREFRPNFEEEDPPPNSAAFGASHSAGSGKSADSGISDPGEEYAFVITENSSPDLVKQVEEEFTPVEDLDLTIRGKACPRLLSGSQQTRLEEAAILESLRQEGFIATSKSKSAGGISFEVVEAAPGSSSAGGTKPEDFLPQFTQKKLEERRAKFGPGDRTRDELQERWSGASQRRQAELAARQEKMAEQIKGSESEKQRLEQLAKKQETKTDAALAKREEHLKALRDKLKQQNQRAQQVKLKKLINGPPVPVPLVRTTSDYGLHRGPGNRDLFFD